MLDTNYRFEATCPKCGKVYHGHPALSRHGLGDICPDCGIREALESLGCDHEAQEHILGVIHSSVVKPD